MQGTKDINFWSTTETKVVECNSSEEAFISLLSDYDNIYEFNEPVLKYFHKSYYSIFESLKERIYDKGRNIVKKMNKHFRVYPFFEYVANLGNNDPEIKSEDKIKTYDFSILIKLLKQMLRILQYNINKKKEDEKNYKFIIQTYPIFDKENLDQATFNDILKLRKNMNWFVIELLEISEVYTFLIPEKKNCSRIFSDKLRIPDITNGLYVTYEQMDENLIPELEKIANDINISDLTEKKVKKWVPSEFEPFIESLRLKNKNKGNKEITGEMELLECLFICNEYKLENIDFKIDKYFLLEYYFLVQINRIMSVFSKDLEDIDNEMNFSSKIKQNSEKELPKMIENFNKDNQEGMKNTLKLINQNYIFLAKWIGTNDFVEKLLFLEDEVIKTKLKPLIYENMTPLSLFYIFLTKFSGDMDPCELNSKFMTNKAIESENFMKIISAKTFFHEINEIIINNFIENNFLDMIKDDNYEIAANAGTHTDIYLHKIIFKNILFKYESSIHNETLLDKKNFQMDIEISKNTVTVTLKLNLIDLFMTIENVDELSFFMKIIDSVIPEIAICIDTKNKVGFKINFVVNSGTSFIKKMLETMDYLLILARSFYVICIVSMFYHKPKAPLYKYEIFTNILKDLVGSRNNELKEYTKWTKSH